MTPAEIPEIPVYTDSTLPIITLRVLDSNRNPVPPGYAFYFTASLDGGKEIVAATSTGRLKYDQPSGLLRYAPTESEARILGRRERTPWVMTQKTPGGNRGPIAFGLLVGKGEFGNDGGC